MANYWIKQFDDPVDGTRWEVYGDAGSPGNYTIGGVQIIERYNAHTGLRTNEVIDAMSALNTTFHMGSDAEFNAAVATARDVYPEGQKSVIDVYVGARS